MIIYVFLGVVIILLIAALCLFFFKKPYMITTYEGTNVIKTKSVINKKGEKNGKEIVYDRRGKKNKVSYWKNGVRDGVFTVYWGNGRPYIKGTYRNGKLSGHYVVYDKTGKKTVFEKKYD